MSIELVDLVDSSGNIQKRLVPRTKADLYPNLHLQIIVGVVFDSSGRMLVQRRSLTKKVNPGDIDHVCGAILSGETPEQATTRESLEETGINPVNLSIITAGINKYSRYRYLVVGRSDKEPKVSNPKEVDWVRFVHLKELLTKASTGEYTFVDEFFEDTQLALQSKAL